MLAGGSDREIATELGVSPSTVWRWRCDPGFAAELRTAQRDRIAVMADRMHALAFRALDVLASILNDEQAAPMLRMRAAEVALDRAGWSADGKEKRVALAIEAEMDSFVRLLAERLPEETPQAIVGVLNETPPEPEKPAKRRPRVTVSYDEPEEEVPLEDRISMTESILEAMKSQLRETNPEKERNRRTGKRNPDGTRGPGWPRRGSLRAAGAVVLVALPSSC
jgi:hypothetical protein